MSTIALLEQETKQGLLPIFGETETKQILKQFPRMRRRVHRAENSWQCRGCLHPIARLGIGLKIGRCANCKSSGMFLYPVQP